MQLATTGLFLLTFSLLGTPPAQAQAADVSQLLTGKGAPMTLKLKELDSTWRVFTASSNSYAGMMSSMMGGGAANDVFTKGDTLTAGGDVFLVVYKPAPVNLSSMFGMGGSPKLPSLTPDTVLRLGLLNLHAVSELEGIHTFNLDDEVSSSKQASDLINESIKSATKTSAPADKKLLANKTKAPDFTVHDANGKAVKLSQYKGHVVVLDFWATWCGPCQSSLPITNKVAAKYASKGVVVLAVNVWDSKAAFDKWLPDHKNLSSLKFAIDTSSEGMDVATKLYRVTGIPTQYVIDKNGKIVQSSVGDTGDDVALTKAINAALGAG